MRALAIVGTGLIGASVGLAARAAGVERRGRLGLDAAPSRPRRSAARSTRRRDLGEASPAPTSSWSRRPVDGAAGSGARGARRGAGAVHGHRRRLDEGRASCAPAAGSARFVGGHPICGSEARGPERATRGAVRGRDLVPDAVARDRARALPAAARLRRLARRRPVAIDPEAHDRLVALTSHLPHALANLLAEPGRRGAIEGHEPLAAAGGSLRDMTRVAGANPRIWVDIFLENREALAEALAEHRRRVEQLERRSPPATRASSRAGSARRPATAGAARDRLRRPGALQRLRVHVPDRPGVLAGITQALGAERINIEDFELHHFSPERGGTLAILVAGERRGRARGDAARGRATASSSPRCSDES